MGQPDQQTVFNDLDHFTKFNYKGGADLPVIESVGIWTDDQTINGINIYYKGGITREHKGNMGDE